MKTRQGLEKMAYGLAWLKMLQDPEVPEVWTAAAFQTEAERDRMVDTNRLMLPEYKTRAVSVADVLKDRDTTTLYEYLAEYLERDARELRRIMARENDPEEHLRKRGECLVGL